MNGKLFGDGEVCAPVRSLPPSIQVSSSTAQEEGIGGVVVVDGLTRAASHRYTFVGGMALNVGAKPQRCRSSRLGIILRA